MRNYSLLYTKIWTLVVSMVAVPVFTIIPFLLFVSQYKNLPDTIIYILIFVFLAFMILLSFYVLLKHAQVPVEVTIVNDGLEIYFKRKTIFYWLAKRKMLFDELESITNDKAFDYSEPKFIGLKLKIETGKIILTAPRKRKEELRDFVTEFGSVLEQYYKNKEGWEP